MVFQRRDMACKIYVYALRVGFLVSFRPDEMDEK